MKISEQNEYQVLSLRSFVYHLVLEGHVSCPIASQKKRAMICNSNELCCDLSRRNEYLSGLQ